MPPPHPRPRSVCLEAPASYPPCLPAVTGAPEGLATACRSGQSGMLRVFHNGRWSPERAGRLCVCRGVCIPTWAGNSLVHINPGRLMGKQGWRGERCRLGASRRASSALVHSAGLPGALSPRGVTASRSGLPPGPRPLPPATRPSSELSLLTRRVLSAFVTPVQRWHVSQGARDGLEIRILLGNSPLRRHRHVDPQSTPPPSPGVARSPRGVPRCGGRRRGWLRKAAVP